VDPKDSNEQTHSEESGKEALPPVGQSVWVKCGDYRTLAYLDRGGVWRSVANGEALNVTKVLWGSG
jgi:hypothetical protein